MCVVCFQSFCGLPQWLSFLHFSSLCVSLAAFLIIIRDDSILWPKATWVHIEDNVNLWTEKERRMKRAEYEERKNKERDRKRCLDIPMAGDRRQKDTDTLSKQWCTHTQILRMCVFLSPDWLVVKLMLEYWGGKGLSADTSFIAWTCEIIHSSYCSRAFPCT